MVDRPGVLAAVSEVFSDEGASIELMRQTVGEVDDQGTQHAKLVLATHSNTDAILRRTVDRLGGLSVVRAVKSVIRVEGQ
ncbi:MAG: ACT domain-containing protein [Brevibacterium aurantiacum]